MRRLFLSHFCPLFNFFRQQWKLAQAFYHKQVEWGQIKPAQINETHCSTFVTLCSNDSLFVTSVFLNRWHVRPYLVGVKKNMLFGTLSCTNVSAILNRLKWYPVEIQFYISQERRMLLVANALKNFVMSYTIQTNWNFRLKISLESILPKCVFLLVFFYFCIC